ncbi:hypothetical protein [Actinokineospora xionganensis]|uniref:Uncharacterized protein n=1 Tax=Actinokineospora xionganensis TaxID=2684470 RepID=A0ABR7L5W2_9PSEU|nr:hypothetical protein [Actinokineospora xionganensis]MBC6448064.1 hypothetical protein [Actinokineospora xionganensis]
MHARWKAKTQIRFTTANGGQAWVTLAPDTDAAITRQLDELVNSLT